MFELRQTLCAVTVVLVVGASACSSGTTDGGNSTDAVRTAYDLLIEEEDRGCPGVDFGPACRPHVDELFNRARKLREAIRTASRPERYVEAVKQLDWMDEWASRGLDSAENQTGVSFSVSMLRQWADQEWPK